MVGVSSYFQNLTRVVELFSFDANHPEISRRGHYPWMDETGDGHVLFLVWACAMLSKEMYMLVGNL